MSRNLIFLFDGSSNTIIGPKNKVPTNIYHLTQAISNGSDAHPQISFYFSGVGTYGDRMNAATGKGFDEIVIAAYTNLSSNYRPGDRIYLFGFSRGAAAARALSALISWPGLLRDTELINHFQDIWDLYTRYPPGVEGTEEEDESERMRRLEMIEQKIDRPNYCAVWRPSPKVNFLGVFDTVPGCSWDREKMFIKLRIRNLCLESCVENAVQLLSMDDNRIPSFEPLLWSETAHNAQHVEQIWMPGVHADVGGSSDGVLIGYIALLTMLARMQSLCPELELEDGAYGRYCDLAFHRPKRLPIAISDEREGLAMRLLLERGVRHPGARPGERVHELLDIMQGRRIQVRGHRVPYEVAPYWRRLPVHVTPFSDELRRIA